MENGTSSLPQRLLAIITNISHKILDRALSPKSQENLHDFAVRNPKIATFIGLQILLCAIPFLLFLALLLSLAFISLIGAAFFLFLPLLFASSFAATALSLFLLFAYIIWQCIERRYRPRLTMGDMINDIPAFAALVRNDDTHSGAEDDQPRVEGQHEEPRAEGENDEPGVRADDEVPGMKDSDEQPSREDKDGEPGAEDNGEPGAEDDGTPHRNPQPSPLPSPPPSPPPNPLPHPLPHAVMGGNNGALAYSEVLKRGLQDRPQTGQSKEHSEDVGGPDTEGTGINIGELAGEAGVLQPEKSSSVVEISSWDDSEHGQAGSSPRSLP